MRVLLVEDDRALADELRADLREAGFVSDQAVDGSEAEFLGGEITYDAIILDLGLPGKPGLDVLRAWRARGIQTPVLILTARDAWHERVTGLQAGADDYLGKPFHREELLARLRALIRRSRGQAEPMLEAPGLRLDEERQEVVREDGRVLALTGTEFRLLRYFMRHPGVILSKTRLTEHIYDQDFERESNLIEVYVRRLRKRIGRDRIQTKRGQGYLFR